jgi:hypothetical protein
MNELLDLLTRLPEAEPSQGRADRVRARARRHLASRRRQAVPSPAPPGRAVPLLWLAAAVSAALLVEVLAVAADVLSWRFHS